LVLAARWWRRCACRLGRWATLTRDAALALRASSGMHDPRRRRSSRRVRIQPLRAKACARVLGRPRGHDLSRPDAFRGPVPPSIVRHEARGDRLHAELSVHRPEVLLRIEAHVLATTTAELTTVDAHHRVAHIHVLEAVDVAHVD